MLLDNYGSEVGFELGDKVKVQQYHTDKKGNGTVLDYRSEDNTVKVSHHGWLNADRVYKA